MPTIQTYIRDELYDFILAQVKEHNLDNVSEYIKKLVLEEYKKVVVNVASDKVGQIKEDNGQD